MRKPPDEVRGAEVINPARNEDLIVQEREYELITPLFGGGVEPGCWDPLTPIRGTEIRGHLRFWWRATRGWQFNGSLHQMRKVEDLIWGSASNSKTLSPSAVQVFVKSTSTGRPDDCSSDRDLQYVAFPLQEERKTCLKDVRFSLKISFPKKIHFTDESGANRTLDDVQREVEAALWSWGTFGGLGARTRRGFGALHCARIDGQPAPPVSSASNPSDIRKDIRRVLKKYLGPGEWPQDVPRLEDDDFSYRISPVKRNSKDAWTHLIGLLKSLRQHRREFGRSRWPEPDAIRLITGQWSRGGHGHSAHEPKPDALKRFPRAAFGLPIIFHFKDADPQNPKNPKRDPRDVLLRFSDRDRLASPLIIRPLRSSDRAYVGLAVALAGVLQPDDFQGGDIDLVLTEKDGRKIIASGLTAKLSAGEAASIKNISSGKPLLGKETDPLIAFLDQVQKETQQ